MENLGRITGNMGWKKGIIVMPDAVYVTSNHEDIPNEDGEPTMCSFDCIMYKPEEYTEIQINNLTSAANDLTDTQMALAETYELSVATADDLTETQLALAEVYELVIGG